MGVLPGRTATIDLANPVSASVTVDGINWKYDSVTGTTTPDSSGNGLTGNLDANTGSLPTLTTGVDLAGTSGYNDGLNFVSGPGVGNPRVFVNMAASNPLGMQATSFTGGSWIKFDSTNVGGIPNHHDHGPRWI